jgi:PAS domain S-box-containing protein
MTTKRQKTQRLSEKNTIVLLALGQKLNAARSPEEAGVTIANSAETLFGWDACFIYLCDASRKTLFPIINIDTIDDIKRVVPPAYDGTAPSPTAREVLDKGPKLVLREAPLRLTDGALPFGDKSRPSASLMYVPMRNGSQVVGIFSIQSYTTNAYDEQDLQALQSLADHCAGALERLQTTEALKRSEEQFRTLADFSPLGIFKTDAAGNCIYNNPRLLAISEITEADCLDYGWANSVHPDDRAMVVADWCDAMKSRRNWANEHRILTRTGKVRWVRALAHSISDSNGQHTGYVGCVEDITERKVAEEELQQAQRELRSYVDTLETRVAERTANLEQTIHSLESFTYSIAHDLRSPLRAMQGFSAMLLEDYGPKMDEGGRDLAVRVVESARRMDRLIQDLLSYSYVTGKTLDITPVNVRPAIEMVLTELANEITAKGATVTLEGTLPEVLANATVIQQVFLNLINNAMKFVAPETKPVIRISAETTDSVVRFSVQDNGIGIAPEHHQRIFDVFQRLHSNRDYPGTGIGLAIVRKGVERMAGKVGVQSEIGKGTRFWVELPLAQI